MKTIIINLFAGPGSGKTSLAYMLLGKMKVMGIHCEFASEYAKNLVYEERNQTFGNQIYIFAKQHHKLFNFVGKTDVVVCDSPLLLTPVYDAHKRQSLAQLAVSEFNKFNNLNIFVHRKKKFEQRGRVHNLKEALSIDKKVLEILKKYKIDFLEFDSNDFAADQIIKKITKIV